MKLSTLFSIIVKNVKIGFYKLLGKSNKLLPYKVLISATNKCNSRCKFCNIWKIKKENPELIKNEICLEDFISIFKNLNKHLIILALTGGEVSLVSYFKKIIDMAKIYCKNLKMVSLSTNGLLPNKIVENALYVKNAGYDVTILISLDGEKELHDSVRGIEGSFEKCLETARKLREKKIDYVFNMTISDNSLDFIKYRMKYFKYEIKSFTFVHSIGIYKKQNQINYEKIKEALKIIKRNYKVYSISDYLAKLYLSLSIHFIEKDMNTNIIPCEAMNSAAHIMSNGDIHFCMYLPKLGNIKENNIQDIFKTRKAYYQRQAIEENKCPHCWLPCYSQYSIMQHPFVSFKNLLAT